MNDHELTVQQLKDIVNSFIKERDWSQFHNPKNLSMAIATEAAELMEHFLWIDGKQSHEKMNSNKRTEIEHEISDITWMLLCLCNAYNIDLCKAMENKMVINKQHYSVEKAKGRTEKYTEL